ncbi:methyltransferase type 12 [Neosynechococcus sphagnicola sy1]|uniref:Methyltransferase type 12 n=1 Tax=Neosynechococcus sphagnicola sy1 TaxID=1497020 RepID=A0A098TLR5_9CYAN|nr:methyltransferase [Neosynechococcus sphagnicola]KGF73250.1 methyltransferase type 12 [Neosynechococcus sphagnicola sy1]
MSDQLRQPSPELFFETVNAYQRTATIKAALELDVFTAIGEGRRTIQALAARCETSERGMRILCDYLVILSFLTKVNGQYGLTQDSALFLDRRSEAYIGNATEFLLSPMIMDGFEDIVAAVRKGGTVIPEDGTVAPENPVWVKFARGMASMMALPAKLIAKFLDIGDGRNLKVLDIAASHGLFGIEIALLNPNAEVVALDWPNVLEVAKENAQNAGVSERYSTLEGSAFDVNYGNGYDIVLLTNFLHHFDPSTCEGLLKKVHASLAAGGRVVTLEMVANEDRVSPPIPASFSMIMLASTPRGDAYTFSELQRMFENTGFLHNELHQLPPTMQRIVISHK